MKKILTTLLSAALLLAGTLCSAVTKSKTHFAEDALRPYVESGELAGAISILYKDGVQETCCIGYSDMEKKRPIKLTDIYMQCSQTKGFCGVTMAKLIEEGRVQLDDPVSKYLPEFEKLYVIESSTDSTTVLRLARNTLTIRMVLNHTGGFPFEISAKSAEIRGGGWSGGAELRQVAATAAASPLLFEPGTAVNYSNTGIDIAAAVIEVVTGMPWDVYLKQTVLDPLGMKHTTFRPTDRQLRKKIELYDVKPGEKAVWVEENPSMQRPYNRYYIFPSAGAGLWTTAEDQIKFYKMLMNLGVGDNGVRVLKEETVKNLLAVSTRPADMGGYSLGLTAPVVDSEKGWFGHGGAFGTNCSVNWHTKELKMFVVQISKGKKGWEKALREAQDNFFNYVTDNSVSEYTGRIN